MSTMAIKPIAPPIAAQAYGINKVSFSDHFDSLNTIDLNATAAAGFNWYSTLWTQFTTSQGTVTGIVPFDPAWLSISDSILKVSNNQAYISNGKEFISSCWHGGDTWTQTVPLIDLSKPVYLEVCCSVPNPPTSQANRPAVWLVDQNILTLGIDGNTAATTNIGEIDILEFQTNGTNLSSAYIWTGISSAAAAASSVNVGTIDANFHRFGYLHVPMAYNNGTGFGRWYLDNKPSRSDIVWTPGSSFSPVENSRCPILFCGIPNQDVLFDYIAVWTP